MTPWFAVKQAAMPGLPPNAGVALLLQLQRQLLAARLDDPAVAQHVDEVGHDVVEQPLVVGDDDASRAPGVRSALTPSATIRSASMSRPESVSSRMASFGSSTAIWKISLRFFSPPEKPSLTGRFEQVVVHLRGASSSPAPARGSRPASSSGSPRCLRMRVERRLQEVGVADAGNLDRVLEGEEDALARPLLRRPSSSRSLPSKRTVALGDLVAVAPGQHAAPACSCRSRSAP